VNYLDCCKFVTVRRYIFMLLRRERLSIAVKLHQLGFGC
jgi:hypothetical protein